MSPLHSIVSDSTTKARTMSPRPLSGRGRRSTLVSTINPRQHSAQNAKPVASTTRPGTTKAARHPARSISAPADSAATARPYAGEHAVDPERLAPRARIAHEPGDAHRVVDRCEEAGDRESDADLERAAREPGRGHAGAGAEEEQPDHAGGAPAIAEPTGEGAATP
jgi:hypothetical protein